MRVLLTTYGSRGDVQPLVGLAVQERALGAKAQVCAPPDQEFAELLAGVGVPLVPIGQPVHPPVAGATRPAAAGLRVPGGTPPSAAHLLLRAAEWVAAHFDTVAAAAEECDAPVATGVKPTGGW